MPSVRGRQKAKLISNLQRPQMMDVLAMEEEIRALMDHDWQLRERVECTRTRCDGEPHVGYPYPHDRKTPAMKTPLAEAQAMDKLYRSRRHLSYLSQRLTKAVQDVEAGQNRFLTVSMPPRSGKSHLSSEYFPTWLLHKHPDWKVGLISHSPTLATSWGRSIRRKIEEHEDFLGIELAKDAGAVSDWETTRGGGVLSRSAPGQSVTGFGFKVLLVDDPVKNFATAHSQKARDELWEYWLNDLYTRLEPPYLVVVVGTRWHEDDLIGRLLSDKFQGDPEQWEVISFPALAEDNDVLGRAPGEPLLSPIVDETHDEAMARWEGIRESVGEYGWAGLYMQRPAPATGAIFKVDSFRYWTNDAALLIDDDPTVMFMEPEKLSAARWVDSWDATFKGTDSSDYVVGQRWALQGKRRFLIDQSRGRRSFTDTLKVMREWNSPDKLGSKWVYEKLIEDAANGPAIIDVLKEEQDGIKPITPKSSKESRARAITPEVEGKFVYLPHPDMPGYEWVRDLVSELRAFPNGANDDQVDAFTQALNHARQSGEASITVPGRTSGPNQRAVTVPKRGSINNRRVAR